MTEYILITALYVLGAYFSALQKIAGIRSRNPQASFKDVSNTYLSEEWNTMMVSGGGLLVIEIFWFIIHRDAITIPEWIHSYGGAYLFSLVLGYCFQRIIYKFLGSTEKAIENKINETK